jgi:hypothetical protein
MVRIEAGVRIRDGVLGLGIRDTGRLGLNLDLGLDLDFGFGLGLGLGIGTGGIGKLDG